MGACNYKTFYELLNIGAGTIESISQPATLTEDIIHRYGYALLFKSSKIKSVYLK